MASPSLAQTLLAKAAGGSAESSGFSGSSGSGGAKRGGIRRLFSRRATAHTKPKANSDGRDGRDGLKGLVVILVFSAIVAVLIYVIYKLRQVALQNELRSKELDMVRAALDNSEAANDTFLAQVDHRLRTVESVSLELAEKVFPTDAPTTQVAPTTQAPLQAAAAAAASPVEPVTSRAAASVSTAQALASMMEEEAQRMFRQLSGAAGPQVVLVVDDYMNGGSDSGIGSSLASGGAATVEEITDEEDEGEDDGADGADGAAAAQ